MIGPSALDSLRRDRFVCVCWHSYKLLTKRKAKFFPCVFMDRDGVEVHIQAKKRTRSIFQPPLPNKLDQEKIYLALINRAGVLYGRILTEVVSADRTQ